MPCAFLWRRCDLLCVTGLYTEFTVWRVRLALWGVGCVGVGCWGAGGRGLVGWTRRDSGTGDNTGGRCTLDRWTLLNTVKKIYVFYTSLCYSLYIVYANAVAPPGRGGSRRSAHCGQRWGRIEQRRSTANSGGVARSGL